MSISKNYFRKLAQKDVPACLGSLRSQFFQHRRHFRLRVLVAGAPGRRDTINQHASGFVGAICAG